MNAGLVQCIVIFGWNDAAAHDDNIATTQLCQLSHQLWHERQMTCKANFWVKYKSETQSHTRRLCAHANTMHIGVDRLSRHLGRRCEQSANVHVIAKIGKAGGDYLRTAIVSVLAHFCDENTWLTTFGGGKLLYAKL